MHAGREQTLTLVIVDPELEATVDEDYHEGWIRDWSIYEGFEFHGMPETTARPWRSSSLHQR